MKKIIIKTQKDWDALPERFEELTALENGHGQGQSHCHGHCHKKLGKKGEE